MKEQYEDVLKSFPQDFRQVCKLILADMARLPVAGVAVGIQHAGQQHLAGFGVTNVEHPLPVTPDTLFQVGSITKTFLGTAVMRLEAMGKLNLDQPLRELMPELKLADETVAQRVTLRHLLTHTGGWEGDYFNDFGRGEDALEKMAAQVAILPQVTPLGEIWSYNNAGFYLAGRAIEISTGQPFETAIAELVLEPLGLKSAFFFAEDVISHRFVVGHDDLDGQLQVARPWAVGRAVHAPGGLVTSVPELLRYASFHMQGLAADGSQLVPAERLRQMRQPIIRAGGDAWMGLTWFSMPLDASGVRVFYHGGGTKGQVTFLGFIPELEFAVAVLTNSEKGGIITYRASDIALQAFLGLGWPKHQPLPMAPQDWADYLGHYDAGMSHIEVFIEGEKVIMQVTEKGGFPTPETPPMPSPPPVRLGMHSPDRAIGLDEPFKDSPCDFMRDAEGGVSWLRVGGRVHKRV